MSQRYSFNNLFYEVSRRCNLACPQCMAGSADPQRVAESAEREPGGGVVDCSICTLRHRARDLGGVAEKAETVTE